MRHRHSSLSAFGFYLTWSEELPWGCPGLVLSHVLDHKGLQLIGYSLIFPLSQAGEREWWLSAGTAPQILLLASVTRLLGQEALLPKV